MAIGLAIRFGNFFFFTAGDLPGQGELLVAPRLLGTGFPNPQGGPAFAPATRIAAFKVSHHGAASSTPAAFLQAINARAAFISCGKNTFGKDTDPHPTQAVVDRLNAGVPRFFLTNCKYTTQYIPASDGEDQLVLVGQPVSGLRRQRRREPGRSTATGATRCSIWTEPESTGAGVARSVPRHVLGVRRPAARRRPADRVAVETHPF